MAASKKTVLITGSTRGIGLAFAEYYTKAGWNVIGTARAGSNTDKLAALSPFKIVTLDAGDEATVLDTARQLDGVPIHLLINNAGIGVYSTFETATKADIMKVFEVNAVGPFLATRALLPNLKLATDTTDSRHRPADHLHHGKYRMQQRRTRATVPRSVWLHHVQGRAEHDHPLVGHGPA
ncbi:hypothetical protein F441_07627 [Phytophthora nicotianae CJ01A1]|uniref:Uncharacterized protein n=1 Tax=Phytophthora nicotianae CJ01A1 TaxID=1317063 RepID=W2X867_PHYNI|nr:hypothetical protein F441_07627 [Phytophthora nicotianae CJ01A1]